MAYYMDLAIVIPNEMSASKIFSAKGRKHASATTAKVE